MSDELKKAIKEQKLVYGTNETIKRLKLGSCKAVFIASNCPKRVRDDIKRYSGLCGAAVNELDIPDSEIGMLCKRRHSVSVLCY